jgi:hypothetical protein
VAFGGVEDHLKAYVRQVINGGLVTHLTDPEDRAKGLAIPEDQRWQWVAWMWPIEPIHYVWAAGGPSRSPGFGCVCRPISVFKWSRDLRRWHTYLPPGTQ